MAKGILAAALLIAVGVFAGRVFFSAEAPSELPATGFPDLAANQRSRPST
jgi:hypothetical protein